MSNNDESEVDRDDLEPNDDKLDAEIIETDAGMLDDESPENELERLRAENKSLFERLARVQADFQNARRRMESDLVQRSAYANSELIRELLPVIDNFERALAIEPETEEAKSLLKGMQIVHDDWLAVLTKNNVEQINPEPGSPFDPNIHSAMMQQADERYDEPTVLSVFQKGYNLNGRPIRPAAVCVSQPK